MARVRRIVFILLLSFVVLFSIGCKEVDYSNNNIYTNDFLLEHFYSQDIKYKLVLDNNEIIEMNDYYCNQAYIDMLCHYIKLKEANINITNEIKDMNYSILTSTNLDNKKVEVYILENGKVIINSDNKYFESDNNAVDFNKFSEVVEFNKFIKTTFDNCFRINFLYSYSFNYYKNAYWGLFDNDDNPRATFETKEEYEYYKYTQYLYEYLDNVDLKLFKLASDFYDSGEELIKPRTARLESVINERVAGNHPDHIEIYTNVVSHKEDYEDKWSDMIGIMDYTKDTMIILTWDDTYYYASVDLSKFYDDLMTIYHHEIESLNEQIEEEWIEMSLNLG